MTSRDPLARLMTLAFHLNMATALAMVLWTAWTGYLIGTGQIRPAAVRAAPATPVAPASVSVPDCRCHRDGLLVRSAQPAEAA